MKIPIRLTSVELAHALPNQYLHLLSIKEHLSIFVIENEVASIICKILSTQWPHLISSEFHR